MSDSTSLGIKIDWSEIDLFGHINNVAILKYVQSARVHLLEKLGLMASQAGEKKGPILASVDCQFIKPLFYPGTVTIHSTISLIKTTSFRVTHTIYNDKTEITAKANDIIVLYDFITENKLRIDDDLRKKLESLNG
jgi:acyl-CoA thioester hydrolase